MNLEGDVQITYNLVQNSDRNHYYVEYLCSLYIRDTPFITCLPRMLNCFWAKVTRQYPKLNIGFSLHHAFLILYSVDVLIIMTFYFHLYFLIYGILFYFLFFNIVFLYFFFFTFSIKKNRNTKAIYRLDLCPYYQYINNTIIMILRFPINVNM